MSLSHDESVFVAVSANHGNVDSQHFVDHAFNVSQITFHINISDTCISTLCLFRFLSAEMPKMDAIYFIFSVKNNILR